MDTRNLQHVYDQWISNGVVTRLCITAFGCVGISIFMWALIPSIGQHGFLPVLVHSQCIGLSISCFTIVARDYLLTKPVSIPIHILANLACSATGLFIGLAFARSILGLPLQGEHWFDSNDALLATLLTTLAASFLFIMHFQSRARVSALAASAAEAARSAEAARLGLLKAQLDPHMLFNTLANLKALIATDPKRAELMVDHLVPFLRATLDGSREDWWSIQEEFEELRHYLEIMTIRFGQRLSYELILPTSLQHIRLPTLLLQPLVENAVRHGIEPCPAGGQVTVIAERSASGAVVIEVNNTGRSHIVEATVQTTRSEGDTHSSYGLQSVRERLNLGFGYAATLAIDEVAQDRGESSCVVNTSVRICLAVDVTGTRG